MDQLEPCPHCQRHVRITEAACPFCSAPIARAMARASARTLPTTRLGRAALFAFGVGAGVTGAGLEGCADDADPQAEAPEPAEEPLPAVLGGAAPLYGSPPPRPGPRPPIDPVRDGAVDASTSPGGDAGETDAGAPAMDASTPRPRDPGATFPIYAAPPRRVLE
jgi:hypothetical protein